MIGIICEYNPFHNGHLYHLNKVKEMFPNQVITLILVGNFLNRGEISVVEKYDKTKLALDYGVDLVVELPTCFAIQAADIYAYGAITILDNLNCDYLVFGSESNDLKVLDKIAQFQLDNSIELNKFVKKGYNYPTSLSLAIQENLSIKIDSPNDLLAVSYIKAIKKLDSKIKPVTIKRTNDYHSNKTTGKISSATSIRHLIYNNKDKYYKMFTPPKQYPRDILRDKPYNKRVRNVKSACPKKFRQKRFGKSRASSFAR